MDTKWIVEYKCRPSFDTWTGYLADLGKFPKDEMEARYLFNHLMSDSSVTDIRIILAGPCTTRTIDELHRELDPDIRKKQIERLDDIWEGLDFDMKLRVLQKAGLR